MERKVLKSIKEVEDFFRTFNTKAFAFDVETTSLKYMDMELEGISFCDGTNSCYIDLINNPDSKNIFTFLSTPFINAKIIFAHNIIFDLKCLHKVGIIVPDTVELFCTMVADHLVDENRAHNLKFLANLIFDHDTTKYKELGNNHQSKEFYEYAINDAEWTWELAHWEKDSLEAQGLIELFREIEMPFQRVLLDIEVTGILIDQEEINTTSKQLIKEIEELEIGMHDSIDEPYDMQMDLEGNATVKSNLNLGSPKQLGEILFGRLGLDVVETTPSGKPSVGKKTLYALKGKHPFLDLLEKYKIARKLLNAFFTPLPSFIDSDGRIRPNFRDTGTKTGRLSCSNPNLQQLPKMNKAFPIDTRKCFVVPKGKKMIACDYSGQELRVLTEITQEPALIDTFNKGKDMHLSTANDFFDLEIPEEALYSEHPDNEKYKKRFYDERNKAKVINFGMAYGKGAYGFSKDFGITEDEAQIILDKYFAALPAVKQAIEKTHRQVKANGFVTSMSGRRRRFQPLEVDGNKFYPKAAFRQSFNFLIQGFSADMIRIAAIKTRQLARDNPQWMLKTLMTVHDEIVYEVEEEFADVAAQAIKKEFETAVKFCIPIVADVSIGNTYSDVK